MSKMSVHPCCGRMVCACHLKKYKGDASAYRSLTGQGGRSQGCGGGCNSQPSKPQPPPMCGGCGYNPCACPPDEPETMCIEFTNNVVITDHKTGEKREIRATHTSPVQMNLPLGIGQTYIDCGQARACGACVDGIAKRGPRGLKGDPGATKEMIFSHLCLAWEDAMAEEVEEVMVEEEIAPAIPSSVPHPVETYSGNNPDEIVQSTYPFKDPC